MKSTRERVLQTLMSNPHATINEIAEAVGINAISVRHHLTLLQGDNLVLAEEERHGVGRPRLVYSLTDKGIDKFPTRFYRLTNNLLDEIKGTIPEKEIHEIFHRMAEKMSSEYRTAIAANSMEGKLDLLKKVLVNEGFEMEWARNGDVYDLFELSCPFSQIEKKHPEICFFDRIFIAKLLSIPESNVKRISTPEKHCVLQITP